MRIAGLAVVMLVGCVTAERETDQAEPLVQIASLRCQIAGAQIVVEGTWDVRLPIGEVFRVDQVAGLAAGTKANMYSFYGCNEWKTVPEGCLREDMYQAETQPVSLRRTENVVTGTLPDTVRVEVAGVVETEEAVVLATRTLTCTR